MKSTNVKWVAAATIVLTAVFCASFVLFYTRAGNEGEPAPPASGKADTPLPPGNLLDAGGTPVSNDALRAGNVVLVFLSLDCRACLIEAKFIRDLGNDPQLGGKVSYYGIVSFGGKDSLTKSEGQYPFKLLYDDGGHLATQLGITRVPVMVYVQDGVIRKAWGGASPKVQGEFAEWLRDLK